MPANITTQFRDPCLELFRSHPSEARSKSNGDLDTAPTDSRAENDLRGVFLGDFADDR